jgi:hypothetical protein
MQYRLPNGIFEHVRRRDTHLALQERFWIELQPCEKLGGNFLLNHSQLKDQHRLFLLPRLALRS